MEVVGRPASVSIGRGKVVVVTMPSDPQTEKLSVTLDRDQALVLSDWLDRRMHQPEFAAIVDDRAVWSALWRISGSLDVQLREIFDIRYGEMLDRAREHLIAEMGDFDQE